MNEGKEGIMDENLKKASEVLLRESYYPSRADRAFESIKWLIIYCKTLENRIEKLENGSSSAKNKKASKQSA